jgi:hypothetical protein
LWNEVVSGDRTGRLNTVKNLSDADLGNRDGNLDRHVGGDAEAAILVGDLSLRVGMGDGNHAANHDQGNAHHAKEDSPRRSQVRGCTFAHHSMNITQFLGEWGAMPLEPAMLHSRDAAR